MEREVVAHGILSLTEDMPYGTTAVQFLLEGTLYEAEVTHNPMPHEGYRMLEVKVKRIGKP